MYYLLTSIILMNCKNKIVDFYLKCHIVVVSDPTGFSS
jgi:hypothetical protein